jgi:hypothetical protein
MLAEPLAEMLAEMLAEPLAEMLAEPLAETWAAKNFNPNPVMSPPPRRPI